MSMISVGCAVGIAAITFAWYETTGYSRVASGWNWPKTHEISVTADGFVPADVRIMEGDSVTFVNTGDMPVWPASDPHPTHEYRGGFDSNPGIGPGNSWTYTFNEAGSWRLHDHQNPASRAEIIVRGRSSRSVVHADTCDGECFDELVREAVEKDGIDAAFRLFQDTYEKGVLPRSCHWTAHQIGEAAYDLFKIGKDFPISDATTYCGYGFYHGFLEGLLRENPDPQYALSFCAKVEEKLGTMGLWNCYHGIGHGFTEDPPPPETEGDFNAMIKPGIEMCEFLFGKSFRDLNLCLTGVFTVPAGFAEKGEYGLSVTKDTIFTYCADQPYRYLKACYGEFAPKLDTILEWDVRNLAPVVRKITDDKLQRLVTWVVPSVMVARDIQARDFSKYVDGCRAAFDGRLREICWGGTVLGFFTHGEPEKQYELVAAFCNSGGWKTDAERRFCWGEGFRQMRAHYTAGKVASLCAEAPEAYRPLCRDENNEHVPPYDDPSFD